jgi:hypothetical protein
LTLRCSHPLLVPGTVASWFSLSRPPGAIIPIQVLRHELPPVVDLRQISVVRRTHEADVLDVVAAAKSEPVPVVELEVVTLRASPSLRIDEPALTSVPSVDLALNRGGDIA